MALTKVQLRFLGREVFIFNVATRSFEKLSAEARKHILQTVDRKVAKFCHGGGIELRFLLYLAGIARLGHDREEQK